MRKSAAVPISFVLLFTVVACGSSDDSSSATSTTAKSAGPVISKSEAGNDTTTTNPEMSTIGPHGAPTVAGEEGSDSKKEYIRGLAKGLTHDQHIGVRLTASQATCVAPKWIDAFGVNELEKNGVSPENLVESAGWVVLTLDEAQATMMVDALGDCKVDAFEFLAGDASDAQTACMHREISPAKVKYDLTNMLMSHPGDDFMAHWEHVYKTCHLRE